MPQTMKTKRNTPHTTTEAVRIGGDGLRAAQAHRRVHGCTLRKAVETLCSMLPLYPLEDPAAPAVAVCTDSTDPVIKCGRCHAQHSVKAWLGKRVRLYKCPSCGERIDRRPAKGVKA